MIRRPPRSTRTDTLFPYTTLFRSQRLHAFDVKQGFTHRTADNFKLVVGFREFDGDLCGRYRIRRCGERCRTSQQIAELFVSGAPDGDPGETVLRYLVAGARITHFRPQVSRLSHGDRKSTRLNSSH